MSVAVKKLTWEDIQDFPEYHGRTEIVDGQLVMSPLPAPLHQLISQRLGEAIAPFVQSRDLGVFFSLPVHVILDEHVHYEPDLSFLAKGRLRDLRVAAIHGAPDLILEVISESNRKHDTVTKFQDYERYGVREYWLVDPAARVIEVWHREGGKYGSLGRFGAGERVGQVRCELCGEHPAVRAEYATQQPETPRRQNLDQSIESRASAALTR